MGESVKRLRAMWRGVRVYFNIMPDKEDEHQIVAQISSGVSFRGANLWVLIFAIFIASLGLNVNSPAVIIGAMLISPLMGPIIGMGLAVGINDVELLKRSARNFGVATLISVLTATAYFLLTPLGDARSELLARTSPTLYDVLIATCGGAAGIIALCTKGKGNVIPGVAIATALMPPLCTAGYGLATGHWLYFLGAFYLFFINTVFISLATYVGVRMMRFRRKAFADSGVALRAQRVVMGIAVLTMLPATVLTVGIVRQSIFDNNEGRFVKTELSQSGTQVISNRVDNERLTLDVVAVGKEITPAKQAEAAGRMAGYGLGKYALNIIQGEQSDSILQLNHELVKVSNDWDSERKRMLELSAQTHLLQGQLEGYTRYGQLATEIRGEVAVLFPQVRTLGLARMVEAGRDSVGIRQYVAAIVGINGKQRMAQADVERLRGFLKERVQADSIVVCLH